MERGLRRGLHIDDEDGGDKYEYGGKYLFIQGLMPTVKKEVPNKDSTICSSEVVESVVEDKSNHNSLRTPVKIKQSQNQLNSNLQASQPNPINPPAIL